MILNEDSHAGYKRALIVRFGGIGDILLSTPMVRALANAYPGITIDYVVGPGSSSVLVELPYINNVYEFDKASPQSNAALRQLMGVVAANGYDLFINLQPHLKSMMLGLAANARTKIAFKKDRTKQAGTGRVRHAIDDFSKHLVEIGVEMPVDRSLDFVVTESARQSVRRLLWEHGVDDSEQVIVVNPNASRPINRWPLDRMAAVCSHFAAKSHVTVVLIGSKLEQIFSNQLKVYLNSDDSIIDTTGKLSIQQLGALIERAATVISCDTGPMHVAAALDAPLICLSGAADPDRTGPISPRSTVIIDRSLPCVPCQRKTCLFGDDIRCMKAIEVAPVIAAVERKLAASPRRLVSRIA